MTSERVSVRGVGAALHWVSVRPSHVRSLPFIPADNDVQLFSFMFTHASLDLVGIVPGDRCLADEDGLAGVVANDEDVAFLDM